MQTHKLFDDLEQKLTSLSRQLSPIEDYLQVASTILRVIKPLYAYLPIESVPILSHDENVTNLVNDRGYEATQPYYSDCGDRSAGRES